MRPSSRSKPGFDMRGRVFEACMFANIAAPEDAAPYTHLRRKGGYLDITRGLKKTGALMAEPKTAELMEKIVSLCNTAGVHFFNLPKSTAPQWFLGLRPACAELKRNIKDAWWRSMTQMREDVAGLEATIIMHPQIWKASGHADTFT